jgi:tRNA(Leu) C34 or U34 (ribose-2'-O)-methylase TrmL
MTQRSAAIVGLINPKNVSNVGGVIRASHCFDATKILYTGIRYDRAARFHTDTKNANASIPLQHTSDIFDHIPTGFSLVCVELAIGATALPRFRHPDHAVYVFGPEDGTLSQDTVNRADAVVFIPAQSSLNLAAAVNVVLYDRQMKRSDWSAHTDNDQLIRSSRDCRNRLKLPR